MKALVLDPRVGGRVDLTTRTGCPFTDAHHTAVKQVADALAVLL